MRTLLHKLWDDQDGVILSSEVILVGTILVIGSIVGLTTLQSAVTAELVDAANSVESMGGDRGNTAFVSNSESIPEISGDGGF